MAKTMKGCKKGGCWAGRRRTRKLKGGNFYGVGAAIAPGAIEYNAVTNNGASTTGAIPASDISGGRRRRGMTAKAMKRALKKAGMKTSGKKAALTKRMKKMGMKGGAAENANAGTIPSPHAVASYSGRGIAGMIDVSDVGGSVPNGVVSV